MTEEQQVIALLRRARVLIHKGWTQGTFARNAKGEPVIEWSVEAVSFCLSGALLRAAVAMGISVADPDAAHGQALKRLRAVLPAPELRNTDCGVGCFNDFPGTQVEDVLRVIDRAIGGK